MFRVKNKSAIIDFLNVYNCSKVLGLPSTEMKLYKMKDMKPSVLIADNTTFIGSNISHLYTNGDYEPEFISNMLICNSTLESSILITDCWRFNMYNDWRILSDKEINHLLNKELIDGDLYDFHKEKPYFYKKRNLLMRLIKRYILG